MILKLIVGWGEFMNPNNNGWCYVGVRSSPQPTVLFKQSVVTSLPRPFHATALPVGIGGQTALWVPLVRQPDRSRRIGSRLQCAVQRRFAGWTGY